MKTTKKAARIGSDQLLNGIAAASTSAKARIKQLNPQDVDGVAGGIDLSILGIGSDDGTTMGMFPSDNSIGH
jgi:6-phosphogluconolactonase/glucosamine-6-phosphate isomerase/deaminase